MRRHLKEYNLTLLTLKLPVYVKQNSLRGYEILTTQTRTRRLI